MTSSDLPVTMVTMNKKADLLVRQILSQFPETRNDDKELIIRAWEAQGLILSFYQKQKLRTIFSNETIRRSRQKIQEEGLFPPDEKTRRGRRLKQEKMRIELRKKQWVFDKETQTYREI